MLVETLGRVLRDKTAKPTPVYREIGRDHSSDEDFVVDQAAPDLDDSPDDSPDQGPPQKKTRTQGKLDVQARSEKGRSDRHVDERTPDTPKTPPPMKPGKSTPTQSLKPDKPTPKPPVPTLTPTPKPDTPEPRPPRRRRRSRTSRR
ncbi:hypothetical protein PF001_g2951 [Phytophthora fragariae]|uniref:Uncharacterized protein n=1 Tax=Phytophthora fragariae TaxID=53985 RepID=A0A6A4ENH0_9STRA|nr:hypothetical protein PF001_g2951 [Phytophthora fragariae]